MTAERRSKIADAFLTIGFTIFRLLFIMYAAIFLNVAVLHFVGIGFGGVTLGESMLPNMKPGTLFVIKDGRKAPFENLEVGDVIAYREREENPFVSSTVMIIGTKGENGVSFSVEKAGLRDEGITYKEREQIVHRVVSVVPADEENDHAVFARGDNNDFDDPYPVMESGYVGKVVWYANGIGIPLRWFYQEGGAFWFVGVGAVLLFGYVALRPDEKKDV